MRPILRWAGSKRKILDQLSPFWKAQNFTRYIECFTGSGSLFFSIKPNKAILNDINSDLIHLYDTLVKSPKDVHELYTSYARTKERYYEIRDLVPEDLTTIERAARFLYLNRNCFNGLYRTNQSGEFNVPFSGSKTGKNFEWEEFEKLSNQLKKAEFYDLDFEKLLTEEVQIKKGDFVYLDPPYAMKNKEIYTQYGNNSFGTADIERLKKTLKYIENNKGRFVLSYGKSEFITKKFKDWIQYDVSIQRNIAGFAKNRRKDSEIIVTNIKT